MGELVKEYQGLLCEEADHDDILSHIVTRQLVHALQEDDLFLSEVIKEHHCFLFRSKKEGAPSRNAAYIGSTRGSQTSYTKAVLHLGKRGKGGCSGFVRVFIINQDVQEA